MTDLTESKAVRLGRYLREFVQSRTPLTRELKSYESVLWFKDVPLGANVSSAAHRPEHEDDEAQEGVWLEVSNCELPEPPAPVVDLAPWIDSAVLLQPGESPPTLKQTAVLPDPGWDPDSEGEAPLKSLRLEDHPGVPALYEQFVHEWESWAEGLRDKIRTRDLYRKLFAIHTQILREGEQVELCIGFGLLDWPENGKRTARVHRHTVTASVDLRFLSREGLIRLECPEEGVRVSLEDDMLEPSEQPPRELVAEVQQQLDEVQNEDAVWNRHRMLGALETWARVLHPGTKWSPSLHAEDGERDVPALSWAPAIILRRRRHVSMLRLYDGLIDQLINNEEGPPPGWQSLLEDTDDRVPDRDAHDDGSQPQASRYDDWVDIQSETFFPLPANKQQLDIVDTIRNRRGVLVQGPPGTGKSHTIANLMCHLLASGQRVLVTAENPRALSVLRKKLPEEIQPLCISLLGNGGEAFSELNSTVQRISARRAQWNENESQTLVARLQQDLQELRKDADRVERELRDIRLGETQAHEPSSGYSGAPLAIAEKVSDQRQRFGWLRLSSDDEPDLPFGSTEVIRWLELTLARDSEVLQDAQRQLVPVDELPEPRAVADMFAHAQGLESELEDYRAERQQAGFEELTRSSDDELEGLLNEVRAIRDQWGSLSQSPWCQEAAEAVRRGCEADWIPLLERSRGILKELDRISKDLAGRRVLIPSSHEAGKVLADSQAVLEHLRDGGKWKSLGGLLTPKPVKGREYLLEEVTVDASAPDEVSELEAVILACQHMQVIDDAARLWAAHDQQPETSDNQLREHRLRSRVDQLTSLLELGQADAALRLRIARITGETIPGNWLQESAVDWVRCLQASRLVVRKVAAEQGIHQLLRVLARTAELHDTHPLVSQAHDALAARDTAAYGVAREQIEQRWQIRAREQERIALDEDFARLATSIRNCILEDAKNTAWPERLTDLEEAWAWAFADRWLQRFGDPNHLTKVEAERRDLEKKISKTLESLAAELAWQKFFERLTPAQNNALKGWREAVRMMGKGKGRSAKLERLRRTARQYMEKCRDAIPVWIMPRYLVAEMISPAPGRFDTVIVDEASQMGVEGMFVFYIGKRTVIVGDDQQISPSDIGVKDEEVDALRRKYIPDLEHAQTLGRGGNVYQNAQIRFGRAVTLREHFRCMPEIIQFSNDLCYAEHGTPLDPLRSFGADRLDPVRAVYAAGGKREGKTNPRNEVEAKMIVAQIAKCVADPRYSGRTFGVISLQGTAQAKLIESLILESLEPGVIEERRILCGDSAAFQGDERHVVFLSMVAARGETRLAALTAQSYVQRFNVAVSRAQDQLWLFHSLDPADVKPECLRHRLIQYTRTPHREVVDAESQEFESPFEEAVFTQIAQRGYRARTQVAVGNERSHSYRIDIVVEGLAGNLAVECDGDRWHGPKRYEADMARQRDLERVGWEFVRIAGSAFYRNREQALKPLWKELEQRGIRPAGEDPPRPRVEESPVTPGAETIEPQPGEAHHPTPTPPPQAVEQAAYTQEDATPQPVSSPTQSSESWTKPEPKKLFEEQGDEQLEFSETAPDPRQARPDDVHDTLLDLVKTHGPLPLHALIRRYVKLAGFGRAGRVLREEITAAVRLAIQKNALQSVVELGNNSDSEIVRIQGSPPVVVRPLGDREFEDIPPSEWAQRMADVQSHGQPLEWNDRESLYRTVLAQVGAKSLTSKRRELLDACWAIARSQQAAG